MRNYQFCFDLVSIIKSLLEVSILGFGFFNLIIAFLFEFNL